MCVGQDAPHKPNHTNENISFNWLVACSLLLRCEKISMFPFLTEFNRCFILNNVYYSYFRIWAQTGVILHKYRQILSVSVSLLYSPQQSSATVPAPPTELQYHWLITSYSALKTKSTLSTEHTVTQLKDMKMAHNTEDQVWVKDDIWASVVYLSRDWVSLRGFYKTWKMKNPKKCSWNN